MCIVLNRYAARALHAYALLFALIFAAISMLLLGAALSWSSTNATLIERHNQYYNTVAAAEAATEKVLAAMASDYQSQGESAVINNLPTYRAMIPSTDENSAWASFTFSNGQGQPGLVYVNGPNEWTYQPLDSQFRGMYGKACAFRVIANAQETYGTLRPTLAAVQQDIQLAAIPVFEFGILYWPDLEINPPADMAFSGRVHSNADLYTEPQGTANLTFQNDLTAVGQLILHKKAGDPVNRNSSYNITYLGQHQSKVSSLTLPVGTSNSSDALDALLQVPPGDESASSALGQQRYYNKADLVILVWDGFCTVKSGRFNGFITPIPASQWTNFINTNVTFCNKREGKTVRATQIDVGQLKTWNQTNSTLRGVLGNDLRVLYVADQRTPSGGTESGVRLVNGLALPPQGLTVATPNPLYVQGHYNALTADLGTANTANTLPASLVADAITVLSTGWSDANSAEALSDRTARDTTVNAALITGIVPTQNGFYSGGVENVPRLLENWGDRTFTYNGSIVVMFFSQIATVPWGGVDVYSPPTRHWSFDNNFLDPTKLPPDTPHLRALVRGTWAAVAPNTIPP
jgi:hypothetical protein